jgi:predicted NBD/HSP70 family sugar kinase
VQIRRYHTLLALRELRRAGEASKADIARALSLNNSSTGQIVRELEEDGLIEITGKRHDGMRGQPATLYKLRRDGAFAIGVKLDRFGIETALIDFLGHIEDRIAHDRLLPSPEEALALVAGDIRTILEKAGKFKRSRLAGIGLAQPYNLDAWMPQLGLSRANFAGWESVDFADLLNREMGMPVFPENDGTAATIAELFHGLGREHPSFLYMFIGPAIGGGVALSGEFLRGNTANAGDVAVMPVAPSRLDTVPRPAGRKEILITRASLSRLYLHLDPRGRESLTRADLEQRISRRDPRFLEWLDDCVDALAEAIQSAVAILDVPAVVIDADLDGDFTDLVLRKLGEVLPTVMAEARNAPRLLRGGFGKDAGAIGVASLPLFYSYAPRTTLLTGLGRNDEPHPSAMH